MKIMKTLSGNEVSEPGKYFCVPVKTLVGLGTDVWVTNVYFSSGLLVYKNLDLSPLEDSEEYCIESCGHRFLPLSDLLSLGDL